MPGLKDMWLIGICPASIVTMFSTSAAAEQVHQPLKRFWLNDPVLEEPIPDTPDALNIAKVVPSEYFDPLELYRCVRGVKDCTLVCPRVDVHKEVASLCAMARDICCKPSAVVGYERLSPLAGIRTGRCEFGSKTELIDEFDAAVHEWEDYGLSGVIVIVVGNHPHVVRRSPVRTVIRIVTNACVPGPVIYSKAELWSPTEVVHRGSRLQIVETLRRAWPSRTSWIPEEKMPETPRDCSICMEPRAHVVGACCTSAYCWSCLEPWLAENETCPGCRQQSYYTTFHVAPVPTTKPELIDLS